MTLGQRIQELRRQTGMSQEKLGEMLGVSRQAVSKWEGDNGIPELDTLIAMSRLFGVTIGQLLGVEEPEQGKDEAKAGGEPKTHTARLDEKQVEDILRRYAEQTRQTQQKPAVRREGVVAAACALALAVLLVGWKYSSMNNTIGNLESRLSYLDSRLSDLSYQIGNMEYRIQDILTEQNNPLSSLDSAVTAFDPDAETVTLSLSATLKSYSPGTQIQFVLNWTDQEKGTGQTVSDWVNGPGFETEVELPMNNWMEGVLRLRDADGVIQEQALNQVSFSGFTPEDFQLYADSLTALYSISVGNSGTSTAEDPAVRIYSSYPELFWPVSAELTITLNGETLDVLPLTLTEETPGTWHGRSGEDVRQLRLSQGDELLFSLRMTDNLNREMDQTYTFVAGENRPVPVETAAVSAW